MNVKFQYSTVWHYHEGTHSIERGYICQNMAR